MPLFTLLGRVVGMGEEEEELLEEVLGKRLPDLGQWLSGELRTSVTLSRPKVVGGKTEWPGGQKVPMKTAVGRGL